VSIFQQPKAPITVHVDTSTDLSSYVLIFLQAKAPMCRYSYRANLLYVDIPTEASRYFNGVIPIFLWLIFLQPIFLWPNLLCVDIPTKNLLKYWSILTIIDFSKTTHHYFNSQLLNSMCRYFNNQKLLCIDTSTDLSSFVLVFLQAKALICQYSYSANLLCVDIPTETSPCFNKPKPLCCDTSTLFFVL
jgi:hypothetical protein